MSRFLANEEFNQALKLGQKEYKEALAAGKHPHLRAAAAGIPEDGPGAGHLSGQNTDGNRKQPERTD